MSNEADIKGFSNDKLHDMDKSQVANCTDYAYVALGTFPTDRGIVVKEEPIEFTEFNINVQESREQFDEDVSDNKYEGLDLGDYLISCKVEPQDGNLADNDDVEIASKKASQTNDCYIYCDACEKFCEDFCSKCHMLTYILDNSVVAGTSGVRETLPKKVLEIKNTCSGAEGVFASKTIAEGTKFGPYRGLEQTTENGKRNVWKLKGGKLVNAGKTQNLNWMQLVNCAKDAAGQNLIIFQHENYLYYRTKRQIDKGEELLVYYFIDTECESYYSPVVEDHIEDVYACTFCCLGFSSQLYLIRHRSRCPHVIMSNFPPDEIFQCPFCKINLHKTEYLAVHKNSCFRKYSTKCTSSQSYMNYSCPNCVFKTNYKSHMRQHILIHNIINPLQCKLCDQRFSKEGNLRRHLDLHSEGSFSKYSCPKCTYETHRKSSFQRHVLVHEKNKPYACELCTKKFRHKGSLRRHLVTHSDERQFTCPNCDYKCKTKAGIKSHVRNIHQMKDTSKVRDDTKPFECETCRKRFRLKATLKTHNLIHTGEKLYACQHCDFKCNDKRSLGDHLKKIHEIISGNSQEYKCPTCHYVTTRRLHFQIHMNMHNGVKPFKCKICDRAFARKTDLKTHVLTHSGGKRLACQNCDFKCNYRKSLVSHMKREHQITLGNAQEFKCSKCNYETTRKECFLKHLKTHDRVKPYTCEVCKKQFSEKSTLSQHGLRHSGDKTFTCNQCDYKSYYRSNLRVHLKNKHATIDKKYKCSECVYETNFKRSFVQHCDKHSGIKKFKCEMCRKQFTAKSTLKMHYRTHTDTKLFACQLCEYKCNYKVSLEKHVKKTHVGNEDLIVGWQPSI